jgi:hypothetical protein
LAYGGKGLVSSSMVDPSMSNLNTVRKRNRIGRWKEGRKRGVRHMGKRSCGYKRREGRPG